MTRTAVSELLDFDPASLLQRSTRLSELLGIDLLLQRDDLMPVPLGGNKWIKLDGIVGRGEPGTVYLSNGGVESNHCKTLALWAAHYGRRCHVVLHGSDQGAAQLSLSFLAKLGATYEIVEPAAIAETIAAAGDRFQMRGEDTVIIPGGGHSPDGVLAYSAYASPVLAAAVPDHVVHASGTGGTQAGIMHASHGLGLEHTRVTGISVARDAERGTQAIRDLLSEIGTPDLRVEFLDRYRGPGYGRASDSARDAGALAARHGILLDQTYTAKAFDGLLDLVRSGEIPPGARVLFWHTGGTFLSALSDSYRRAP